MGKQISHAPPGPIVAGGQIFRYEVPVDDRWHTHPLAGAGSLLHVGARSVHVVEFWAYVSGETHDGLWEFRVFGTGHQLPGDQGWLIYFGTVVTPALVWHLMGRRVEAPQL